MLQTTKRTVGRARSLRREMTLPEVLLWQILRTRPGGHKFRRQHPCGRFILDLYCEDAALAIEIDGLIHDSRQPQDAERDRWLLERGIRTCRLAAADVLEDLEPALLMILELCAAKPLHQPPAAAGPPPLQGGFGALDPPLSED
jgi:very-short-patch-repair endonuclease